MASVIIPVALCFFLGPGMGQLYNKEYKKAFILIGISFVVLIVSAVWYFKAMQPYIPDDLTMVDPQAMQEIIKNASSQASSREGHLMLLSQGVLMVLWIYGVFDAYSVAQKKRKDTITGGGIK